MSQQRILMTVTDGVGDVRLNRPHKLNAIDEAQFHAIVDTIADIAPRRDIRCVVLSGEGRAFSVGVDLDSLAHAPALRDLMPRTHGAANLFQQCAWGGVHCRCRSLQRCMAMPLGPDAR